MNPIIFLLTGCAPQHAEVAGTFHAWLSKNTSQTVAEKKLNLEGVTVIDCREVSPDELANNSVCNHGDDNPVDADYNEPDYFRFLNQDTFYLKQGELDAWRSEAIITSEGDFQLTVHHDLGNGQDFRFAFVIDPNFSPSVCIQEGQTCYSGEDNDGDGWIDYADPDCLSGGWEEGFTTVECNDGVDNDGDGDVDGEDSDCGHAWDDVERSEDPTCTDDADNDGDGWVDQRDPDCVVVFVEDGSTNDAYACSNGLDDDGDGLADGDDPGCASGRDNVEDGPTSSNPCNDGADNDGDGFADGDDLDCDLHDAEVGLGWSACANGVDDDSDGDIDADDQGCLTGTDASEVDYPEVSVDGVMVPICADGEDNDGDGYTDTDDLDCIFGADEDGSFTHSECSDGIDNDGDGDVDSADSLCASAFDTVEDRTSAASCRDSDNRDDDGDGWVNAADPDCALGSSNEIGLTSIACNDGLDNDGDGLVDAADAGCTSAWRATEVDLTNASDCADGQDNDGDGSTDADDPGCAWGDLESDGVTVECGDGQDNDGDGLVDGADPDCVTGFDMAELTDDACADGLDNDGDGWVDGIDSDCSAYGYERGFSEGRCGDGLDNDGDGLVDGLDDGCSNPADPWEEDFDDCADGVDNDNDGYVDAYDPDCAGDTVYEDGEVAVSECNDGQDNDGDGLSDSDDPDCGSAWDNIEEEQVGGAPVTFPLDYSDTLTEWSADEDGYTIYYLNAGAAQLNPNNEDDYWSLPQEWLSGYSEAKFAAEEFSVLPPEFSYLGFDVKDPDPEGYAEVIEDYEHIAEVWSAELGAYGFMDPELFPFKVEGNEWRPINETAGTSGGGLDNWVEIQHSYVRIKDGSELVDGGHAEGEFQIFLAGRDAASQMAVKGTFSVEKIRADKWGYPILEDEIQEELIDEGYDIVVCQ